MTPKHGVRTWKKFASQRLTPEVISTPAMSRRAMQDGLSAQTPMGAVGSSALLGAGLAPNVA
jgi:hypothetical protein